jgi:predicted nucleic acid-binding protein
MVNPDPTPTPEPCLIAEAIRAEALAQGVTPDQLAEATNAEARHIRRFLTQREATNTRRASRLLRLLGLRIVPASSGEGSAER